LGWLTETSWKWRGVTQQAGCRSYNGVLVIEHEAYFSVL